METEKELEDLEYQFANDKIQFKFDTEKKLRHYYIYGPPNTRKTSFAKILMERFECILAPYNNDWKELTDNT